GWGGGAGGAGGAGRWHRAGRQLAAGSYRTAVVIGTEAISPLLPPIYLGRDPESVRFRDRLSMYNFGDGAGAVVLTADPSAVDGQPTEFLGSVNACLGAQPKP